MSLEDTDARGGNTVKLNELIRDIDVLEIHADEMTEISDVRYDSRKVTKGDAFVAITGYESDGHAFIPSAAENGAAVVICERAPEIDIPYVLVPDSRRALALASRNYFGDPASEMKMIGVTGTNGKTTTTMLIKHVLEVCRGAKVGLVGTNQNMIGYEILPTERTTPESYELQKLFRQMADAGCEYVVMEVSSHSLVLSRVAGVTYEVGAFTNLTQDHLDFHKTMDEYAKAKSLLFRQCRHGAANLDDEWAGFFMENAGCPILTFSADKNEADIVAKDIRLSTSGVKFCAVEGEGIERFSLGIPGRFSVYNALTVIACCRLLGLNIDEIARALTSARGVKGRMEVVPTDGNYSILIDYAHTPDALENVLKSVREVTDGRVVVLFGCGGDRDRSKRPIMGAIAAKLADYVIVTSDNPRTEEPDSIIAQIVEGMAGSRTPKKVIPDRAEAIACAINNHKSGDVIILAGKGHETYQIVGKEKRHMDEREIVACVLEERAKNK